MTSKASPRSTSLPGGDYGQLPLDLPAGPTGGRSGRLAARASRSPSPAKGAVLMTTGICGPTFIDSSARAVPRSSWVSRLQERLGTLGSTESPLIWSAKTTPQKRSIFRLAPSTRLISAPVSTGTGSGATEGSGGPATWSTPRASDGEKGGPNMAFGAGGHPLPTQMHRATWVTASARDWKDTPGMSVETADGRVRLDQLPRQMAANARWPTVTVADIQGGRKTRSGDRGSEMLLNGLLTARSRWAAPTSTDSKDRGYQVSRGSVISTLVGQMDETRARPIGAAPPTSSATTEKRGAPNPIFACWLMGFPAEWVSGAWRGMRSHQSLRRKPSARSSTAK